jgi:hypothetical protein
VNKIGLIISTHNGEKQMKSVADWITGQNGWAGPLIVIGSGDTNVDVLKLQCSENNISFHYESYFECGMAKRNTGAKIASEYGCNYVAFLNDYQSLENGVLKNLELENLNESIIFGSVEFELGKELTPPRISQHKSPLSRKSSISEVWSIFSSVSEAGLLIDTSVFLELKGWQHPIRKGVVCAGGTGMSLVARAFSEGNDFGYSKNFKVLGGHRNLSINQSLALSRGAMYPYAFTLTTKTEGVPAWLGIRFTFGRIFRLIQRLLKGEFRSTSGEFIEISARLRALINLPPSRHASLLTKLTLDSCVRSKFACHADSATQCEFR